MRQKCFFVDGVTHQVKLVLADFELASPVLLGGPGPLWVGQGFGSLWAGNRHKGSAIHRLDAHTLQETARISLGADEHASFVFVAEDSVWAFVWKRNEPYLYRSDPEKNQLVAKIPVADLKFIGGITVGAGSLWAIRVDGMLLRLDLRSMKSTPGLRIAPINHSGFFSGIAFGEGALWITEGLEKATLTKVDPNTNQVVATIPVGRLAQSPVVGGGFVWVAADGTNSSTRYVWKIDPRTNQVVGRIFHSQGPSGLFALGRTGGPPYLIAGEDAVWVWSECYSNCIGRINF